ncbi:unnamed protein product, partial [Didymodactylos carnosus]
VSLGKTNDLFAADYNAANLPKGTSSVRALGQVASNPKNFITLNGVVVPMGPGEDVKVPNPNLIYNEYIVYDTKQIRMKYLIKLKFLFK